MERRVHGTVHHFYLVLLCLGAYYITFQVSTEVSPNNKKCNKSCFFYLGKSMFNPSLLLKPTLMSLLTFPSLPNHGNQNEICLLVTKRIHTPFL